MRQSSCERPLCGITFSDREMQVLRQLLLGHSDKEIARHIDTSPRTAGRYVDIVRFKLRARNRAHIVMRAVTAGLLSPA